MKSKGIKIGEISISQIFTLNRDNEIVLGFKNNKNKAIEFNFDHKPYIEKNGIQYPILQVKRFQSDVNKIEPYQEGGLSIKTSDYPFEVDEIVDIKI